MLQKKRNGQLGPGTPPTKRRICRQIQVPCISKVSELAYQTEVLHIYFRHLDCVTVKDIARNGAGRAETRNPSCNLGGLQLEGYAESRSTILNNHAICFLKFVNMHEIPSVRMNPRQERCFLMRNAIQPHVEAYRSPLGHLNAVRINGHANR